MQLECITPSIIIFTFELKIRLLESKAVVLEMLGSDWSSSEGYYALIKDGLTLYNFPHKNRIDQYYYK